MGESFWSLDRIEDTDAVLIGEDHQTRVVPIAALPSGACEGNVYREVGETYVEDADEKRARQERVRRLQNRLRRR